MPEAARELLNPGSPLRRHAMVFPASAAWAVLMAKRPDLAAEPIVAGWADAGYPLVARRPTESDGHAIIPLGLPLPPAHGKRRIAVGLARDALLSARRPPLLAHAAKVAPTHWRDCIDDLVRLDPRTRTFGSLAWQYRTKLDYVTETSDLDLLWDMPASDDLVSLLAGVAAIAATAPMRIDGEIIGAAGGVNWAELEAEGSGDVLVKASDSVRMMARAAFLARGSAS